MHQSLETEIITSIETSHKWWSIGTSTNWDTLFTVKKFRPQNYRLKTVNRNDCNIAKLQRTKCADIFIDIIFQENCRRWNNCVMNFVTTTLFIGPTVALRQTTSKHEVIRQRKKRKENEEITCRCQCKSASSFLLFS